MRIVGGKFRGRPLETPKDQGIRPTSDRIREALFSIIGSKIDIENTRVLDLFAGTGALGIEALSRGAAFCLFVETQGAARALIRTNSEKFGVMGHSKIYRRDATTLGPRPTSAGPEFDIVFADPPYGCGLAEPALKDLLTGNWLSPEALVIVEESAKSEIILPDRFEKIDERQYGESQIIFLQTRT
ncbi:16S rRNA (guanine(966)-N(2))-methyltransferase RsmD [Alphaproteobacteria bacterium]|nr:16S rRNA (guanine(966)-N(2))-methyltransferase RsmD [Alphaproteobacteria bacterium]